MTNLELDSKGSWELKDKATQEAALGAHAIGVGDTVAACEHYSEAGRILESEASAARDSAKRHLLHFLAASQYFHGGDYGRAQKLARRVEERFLPEQTRQLFRPFLRDVEQRASNSYLPTMQTKVRELGEVGKHTECLELLKNHPFVLGRPQLSFARAVISEEQKRYHAAAIHHARAMKFDHENPTWPYVSTSLVLWLPAVGRGDEAFEYLQCLLKEIEHPVAKIAASTIYYRRASQAESDENVRREALKMQVGYFHDAWIGFQKLPVSHLKDSRLRDMMSLCFELAAFGYWKLDETERALKISSEGLAFNERFAGLWMVRGMIQEGRRERIQDFKHAIRMGEQSYIPHYHLARDDLEMGEFGHALKHINDTLDRNPSPQIQGVLYGWKAICLSHTDEATVAEVIELFEKAINLAPDIPEVRENYEAFRKFADKAIWRMELKKRQWRPSIIKDPIFPQGKPRSPRERIPIGA